MSSRALPGIIGASGVAIVNLRPILAPVLLAVAVSGCASPETPAQSAKPRRAATATAPRPARVEIVGIDPPTIEVVNGIAVAGAYSVTYGIRDPAEVTKAELLVHARGLGTISRQEVPIVASATFNLRIDPGSFDFGPTISFRAHCPAGVTDWFVLGSDPLAYEERMSPGLQIGSIGPRWIDYSPNEDSGSSIRVTIFGQALTRDCTVEGDVNGRTVELFNANAQNKQIQVLLRRSDFGHRAVAARYLEVKLSLKGPGIVAIAQVPFIE